jgi:hypothetical protein
MNSKVESKRAAVDKALVEGKRTAALRDELQRAEADAERDREAAQRAIEDAQRAVEAQIEAEAYALTVAGADRLAAVLGRLQPPDLCSLVGPLPFGLARGICIAQRRLVEAIQERDAVQTRVSLLQGLVDEKARQSDSLFQRARENTVDKSVAALERDILAADIADLTAQIAMLKPQHDAAANAANAAELDLHRASDSFAQAEMQLAAKALEETCKLFETSLHAAISGLMAAKGKSAWSVWVPQPWMTDFFRNGTFR